jgi:hypothetical protein
MIAKAHTLARIHPSRPEVASKVKDLHKALFDSIPSLLDILLRQNRASGGKPSEYLVALLQRRLWLSAANKGVLVLIKWD